MIYIVTYGSIVDGFEFVGPFYDEETALKYCERNILESWEIIPLTPPIYME